MTRGRISADMLSDRFQLLLLHYRRLYGSKDNRLLRFLLSIIIIISFIIYLQLPLLAKPANYSIHSRQDFNQPQLYPITQPVLSNSYLPIDNWVGRLILPSQKDIVPGADWVWIEIQHAPLEAQSLVGKVVRLQWKNQPRLQSYVQAVKRDVKFTSATKESQNQGLIHPSRLNNRLQVGPLHSLAGSRPNDDVIVTLDNVDFSERKNGVTVLKIDSEPVLATGRFYGLVKINGTEKSSKKYPVPKTCFGKSPCPAEYFRVTHYNQVSGKFDGESETIRIPRQVYDTRGIPPSTPNKLESSPEGKEGWYIYGAKDINGIFIVQALAPRRLFQLQPEKVFLGEEAGLTYIKHKYWQISDRDRGRINKILIDTTAKNQNLAVSAWKEGDKAIVLNLFGGIGGKKAEPLGVVSTVTGHFAFGTAEVIKNPLTNNLKFDIKYQQIYANNPEGIISGIHTWADYMGNLRWGWMYTRPVTDIIIKFDPVTQDYNFDGIKLSPLTEFQYQLKIMMARYRVGDGTGNATVSPAASCVQDSAQALYSTIQNVKKQVNSNPGIQSWLKKHPQDNQTRRFQKLVSLGQELEKQLLPLGIIRADWQSSAGTLAGISGKSPFRDNSIWAAITSWRTMMPRQAQDEFATIFLRHGAKLWFLQTYQVGGKNSEIAPLAPTPLLGQIKLPFTNIPILTIIISRILAAIALPKLSDWLTGAGILFAYGAIALPLGLNSRFLQLQIWSVSWIRHLFKALQLFIMPAFVEELIFRVLLLPHPTEAIPWYQWSLWANFILFLFILYHPLNAKTFYKQGYPTFFDPIFLILVGLLGIACTLTYALTGSLWLIVLIHWIVVTVWLQILAGMTKLENSHKDITDFVQDN
ncbi:MAG: CPBP family glutamic-type intramembrane protease [Cyanobacteria bacterium P01_A01_bin.84]